MTTQQIRKNKKARIQQFFTTTLGYFKTKREKFDPNKHVKRIRILFDTGCNGSLIGKDLVRRLKRKSTQPTKWKTKTGNFLTKEKVKCQFTMPEFHKDKEIEWTMYVDKSNKSNDKYDMIIGQDLLQEIKIDFLFSQGLMTWANASVPMKNDEHWSSQNIDENERNLSFLQDPETTEIEQIQHILDDKYSPANIREEVHKCTELNNSEREELLSLLTKYQTLFDGSLGEWQTQPIKIELKPEAKPYHARPYPVPQSQEHKLKDKVKRLCK